MEFIAQSLEDVLATLRPLVVEWQDDTARRVIAEIEALPVKSSYTFPISRGFSILTLTTVF